MIEFGARLSLKDNMYAVMQKNLKQQRQFSEQINKTSSSIKKLGSQKASPTITTNDKATKKLDVIQQKIKDIKKTVVTPVIKLKDNITSKVDKIRQKLKDISSKTFAPVVKVKDLASKLLSKIKNTLGGLCKKAFVPIVKIKDLASKALSNIGQGLKKIGSMTVSATVAVKDVATAGLSKIGNILKSLAKGVTIAVGLAGTGVTALLGGSLSAGASMEQSIGGVETLFGADAGAVMANADNAYMSAGLSANEYMETVTSFSASLLQSLGGDTQKAVSMADRAIIDMADNANKMGTDMASIQNAYQGFAKQNYTMLDNLKLGYGGTQEEMERLVREASAMANAQKELGVTVDANSMSFDNIVNAISVVQKNMGIANATADEAKRTFTGSFNAMKASAKNLLANLALGGDITPSMEQLIGTASTFLFDNALPMIGRVFESLPDAIGVAIEKGAPKIKQLGGTIVTALKDGLKSVLPAGMAELVDPAFSGIGSTITKAIGFAKSVMQGFIPTIATLAPIVGQIGDLFTSVFPVVGEVIGNCGGFVQSFAGTVSGLIPAVSHILTTLLPVVGQIGNLFAETAPIIADTLGSAFGEGGGIVAHFADVTSATIPLVKQVVMSLAQVFKSVIPAIQPILTTLGTTIQTLFPVIQNVIATFGNIVSQVFPIIATVISVALTSAMPIIQALANLVQVALPIVSNIISVVAGIIQSVMPTISEIFTEVGLIVADIINDTIVPVMKSLGAIFEKLAPFLQSAIEFIVQTIKFAWKTTSPIIELTMVLFKALWAVLDPIVTALVNAFMWLWDKLEPVFSWLSGVLSTVGDFIGSIGDWIGGFFSGDSGSSHAYGLNRVPYDNYPAVLHQGEKVLTRNQADQYERAMSTRGVQLNNTLQPVDRELYKDNSISGIGSTGQPQEAKEANKTGATVHIDKLADTVVIEKEADVDKVVEDMVKKFRKLVPNMT